MLFVAFKKLNLEDKKSIISDLTDILFKDIKGNPLEVRKFENELEQASLRRAVSLLEDSEDPEEFEEMDGLKYYPNKKTVIEGVANLLAPTMEKLVMEEAKRKE